MVKPDIIEDIGESLPSKTIKKDLPCLNLYITVNYKEDGKMDSIKIYGGRKDNNCGCSFYEALADLLTFAIRRIRNVHEARAIVKAMRYHQCNMKVPNKDHITSCVDAIGQVIENEVKIYEEEKSKEAKA